ncbi:PREDICTED: uclacyanin 1-like isoform X1 [Ipomoea nil]|uniref:uclacyanin 1-like isoform X1 n=1 Tax=Ipomoea nil TaxID=35883 RepID=UPI000901F8D7|nr:PREDICTED: uclacyanin 1-like isoform X1 [Ipomoea nil]
MALMVRTLMMSVALISMVVGSAMAANHTVGGPNGGWDTSTNLQSWASSETFMVGDNLIFTYSPMHDVNEVSKADYDSCTSANPLSTNSGGNSVVPLTAAGKRYFICGTMGHCSMGMKLQVNVLAAAAPPPAAVSTTPSSPAPSPSTPSATAPVAAPVNSPALEIAPALPAAAPSKATAESPAALSPVAEDPSTAAAAASPPALDFPGTISPAPAGGDRESQLPPPLPSSANKVNVVAAAFAFIFFMLAPILRL